MSPLIWGEERRGYKKIQNYPLVTNFLIKGKNFGSEIWEKKFKSCTFLEDKQKIQI